jgi:hypothetical protein
MKKLAPGIYHDGATVRISVPELLEHFGFADTPENREECAASAERAWRRVFPQTKETKIVRISDN